MTVLRLFKISGLVILAFVVTAYLLFTLALPQLASYALTHQGLTVHKLTGLRLTANTIDIENIDIELPEGHQASLSNTHVSWHWGEWMPMEITAYADAAAIRLTKSKSTTPSQISLVLPSEWFSRLPIKKLTVAALDLRTEKFVLNKAQLVLTPDDVQLSTEEKNFAPSLIMQVTSKNQFRLIAQAHDKKQATLNAQLAEQSNTFVVKVNTSASIAALYHYLESSKLYAKPDPINALQGLINFEGQIILPSTLSADQFMTTLVADGQLDLDASAELTSHAEGHITGNMSGRLSIADETLRLVLTPDARLTAKQFAHGFSTAEKLQLTTTTETELSISKEKWSIQNINGLISATNAQHAGNDSPISDFAFAFAPITSQKTLTANVLITGWHESIPQLVTDYSEWQIEYLVDSNTIRAKLNHPTNALMAIHKFKEQVGEAHWQLTLGALDDMADAVLTQHHKSLQINQGQLSSAGQLSWDVNHTPIKLAHQSTFQLDNVNLIYEQLFFADISIKANIEGVSKISTKGPLTLRVSEVNPGFPIKDLLLTTSFSVNPKTGALSGKLHKLSANILEGSLDVGPTRFTENKLSSPANVSLRNIQLAELLALEKDSGLGGQGKLNIDVPLNWVNGAVSAREGSFYAKAPGGVVKVPQQTHLQSFAEYSAELKTAMTALENFHFHTLEGTFDYLPNGDLKIKTRLHGRNPSVPDISPVNFNLTIEENIPALLKSLQISKDVTKRLENSLIKHRRQ